MQDNKYLIAGICSIALACLIPVYGFYALFNFELNYSVGEYFNQLSLNLLDWIFPIIGALGIYVYLSLDKILKEQNNYAGLHIPILLLIITTIIFNFGLFILDAIMYLFGGGFSTSTNETLLAINIFVSVGGMLTFGIIDIVVGVIILVNNQKIDKLIVIYGAFSIIFGLLELTLIFSYGIIFITPIAFILLAIHFLKKPEMLEII